jgi:hypothetical protein
VARNDIAPALVELGIDSVEAEEIERQIRENRLENAGLDGVHWWSMQRWSFDPVDAVREARLGWWLSPVIDVVYKRLLDARYEAEPVEDLGGALVKMPVVTWDAAADRFVEDAKSLLPIWQGTLKRAWVEAWRTWPRFSVQPDIPPALPDFSSFKSLRDFYARVRPHGIDPGHPAHVLRIFLEAIDEAIKGGPGSGYHAPHVGLPGVHGGSRPREEAGYAAYVYEKQKYGKKPKESKRKPRQAGNLPKEYPPGTPESIEAIVAEMTDEETQSKPGARTAKEIQDAVIGEAKAAGRSVIMPDEWPALSGEAEDSIFVFRHEKKHDAYESLEIYDVSGELLHSLEGNESSVDIPKNFDESLGCVLVHNHPGITTCFSDDDILTSVWYGARQIQATNGEYVWIMDLPVYANEDERHKAVGDIRDAFGLAKQKMDELLMPRMTDGSMSVAEANHIAAGGLLYKEFMDVYGAEHGVVLRREYMGDGNAPDDVLDADAAIIALARQDAKTGLQFVDGDKIVAFADRKPSGENLAERVAVFEIYSNSKRIESYDNSGVSYWAFKSAADSDAKSILFVGPTVTTKIKINATLTDGKFIYDSGSFVPEDVIKRDYEYYVDAFTAKANDAAGAGNVAPLAGFSAPIKAWQKIAERHPDLIELTVGYTPGKDPIHLIDQLLGTENEDRPSWVTIKAWDESQVNRHPAGTPVDPGTGAGGGRFAPKEDASDAYKEPARVWQGKRQTPAESVPTKLDVGALGERMVAAIFEHLMETPFRTLNDGRSNAPLDLFGDHLAVEVKAGLASNQDGAQKWRSTIGEPGKAEKALLAQMGAEEKRKHNAWKRAEILRRKQAFAEQLSKRTPDGQPVDPVTIGLIFAPDLRTVDLYVIDGYHLEMPWLRYATEKNLLATYRVDEWLN